jgi:hypothetical protein
MAASSETKASAADKAKAEAQGEPSPQAQTLAVFERIATALEAIALNGTETNVTLRGLHL